jgi:large subunit ribosomal protein L29
VTRVAELRELGDEELIERLESLKEELFNLRFQLATGQLDNPMRIKQVRHEVARILTLLRERHLELELEEELARADQEALARTREGRTRAQAEPETDEGEPGTGGEASEEES